MRRLAILCAALVAAGAAGAHGPVATGFSGGGAGAAELGPLTPTTPGDVTTWTTAPVDTIRHGFDVLFSGMQAVILGLGQGYDSVVYGVGTTAYRVTWNPPAVAVYDGSTAAKKVPLAIQDAVNVGLDYESGPGASTYISGAFTFAASDFYDAGPVRIGVDFSASSSAPDATAPGYTGGGVGGYEGGGRLGRPIPVTKRVWFNGVGKTVTLSGGKWVDAAASFGADNAQVGRYLEVVSSTGGSGCNGQIRQITASGDAGTSLTPASAFTGGCTTLTDYKVWSYPDASAGSKRDYVTWAPGTVITVDATGQTEPWIVLNYGHGYFAGYEVAGNGSLAGALGNFVETGQPQILITNDQASTGWVAGRIPKPSATTFLDADHAVVGMAELQRVRSPADGYLQIDDVTPSNDDVGIIAANTWGSHRTGGAHIGGMGVGAILFGNNDGTWDGYYLSGNQVGLSLGTGASGGDVIVSSSCVTGYCTAYDQAVTNLTARKWTIESCPYGLVDTFDTGVVTFEGTHLESGAPLGHQLLLGAQQCSAGNALTVGRPCAEDSDCNFLGDGTAIGSGGTCDANGGTSISVGRIQYSAGKTPTVSSWRWGGLMLGRAFNSNTGWAYFSTNLGSNTSPANNPVCTAAQTPLWFCRGASTSPSTVMFYRLPSSVAQASPATSAYSQVSANISFDGSKLDDHSALFTPYAYVSSLRATRSVFRTTGQDLALNDCLPNGGTRAACSKTNVSPMDSLSYSGNLNGINWYVRDFSCALGGSAIPGTDVHSYIPTFVDAANNSGNGTILGSGLISFTGGTDAAGATKWNNVGVNSQMFVSNGTWYSSSRPLLGIQKYADPAGAWNDEVTCTVTALRSPTAK